MININLRSELKKYLYGNKFVNDDDCMLFYMLWLVALIKIIIKISQMQFQHATIIKRAINK